MSRDRVDFSSHKDIYRSIGNRALDLGISNPAGSTGTASTAGPVSDGRSSGAFDYSKYGRCIYNLRKGIYDYDNYDYSCYC